MLPSLLDILSIALGATATCGPPKNSIEIDRQALSGIWWVQDQYGIPPVTDSRCYNLEFSVNSKGMLNNVEHFKIFDKWVTVSTPEIPPQNGDDKKPKTYYFKVADGVETIWILHQDSRSVAAFGCKNGEQPVLLIGTKEKKRNEALINEVTKTVAKMVTIPKGRHVIEHNDC
nr:unnamed protein product [Callosobruchus chinensis]